MTITLTAPNGVKVVFLTANIFTVTPSTTMFHPSAKSVVRSSDGATQAVRETLEEIEAMLGRKL